jgi:hypothetical protein
MPKSTDISDLQRKILNHVASGWPCASTFNEVRAKGAKSRSEDVSFSRAIRRLENRGLVLAIVWRRRQKGERANALCITPEGLRLIKSLTGTS